MVLSGFAMDSWARTYEKSVSRLRQRVNGMESLESTTSLNGNPRILVIYGLTSMPSRTQSSLHFAHGRAPACVQTSSEHIVLGCCRFG